MRRATIIVDDMGEADVPEVLALEAFAFPHRVAATEPSGGDSGRVGKAQLLEEMTRPWAKLWVARSEAQRVVAFLLAWRVADELHVLNVATHPDHRRCGFARRLIDHAIDFARAHKGRLVILEVRRSNHPAIALYRSSRFFAMGLRRAYYADGEDAIEMALIMDPETGDIQPHPDEVRIDASV